MQPPQGRSQPQPCEQPRTAALLPSLQKLRPQNQRQQTAAAATQCRRSSLPAALAAAQPWRCRGRRLRLATCGPHGGSVCTIKPMQASRFGLLRGVTIKAQEGRPWPELGTDLTEKNVGCCLQEPATADDQRLYARAAAHAAHRRCRAGALLVHLPAAAATLHCPRDTGFFQHPASAKHNFWAWIAAGVAHFSSLHAVRLSLDSPAKPICNFLCCSCCSRMRRRCQRSCG